MKCRFLLLIIVLSSITFLRLSAQKTYSKTVTEFIFSYGGVEFTEEFKSENPQAEISGSNLRFTFFFHMEEDWHIDLSNNLGFITGFGIRNIGISTDEVLPVVPGEAETNQYKIVRRIYTAGVPLLLKIGSFKDRIFFYAGGEYELALHYKEKYWSGTQHRSGTKTKYSQWLGSQTPLLLPSLVGGVQLPGGFNIKFKYYPKDFLNTDYTSLSSHNTYNVSDLSRYQSVRLSYISLSWQFSSDYLKNKNWKKNTEIASIR